jgi:hypothetical protein
VPTRSRSSPFVEVVSGAKLVRAGCAHITGIVASRLLALRVSGERSGNNNTFPSPISGNFNATTAATPKTHKVDRPEAHDPALVRRNLLEWSSLHELPNQGYIGGVHEEEDRGIEGNRRRCQLTHGHPGGGKWSSDTKNRCAKLNHIRRGVASVA